MIPGPGGSLGEGIGYPLQYSWPYLVAQMVVFACIAEDLGSIPWLGRSLGRGKGYSLQYSGLENSMTKDLKDMSKGPQKVGHD